MTKTLSSKITSFLFNLQFKDALPPGVELLMPFSDGQTKEICSRFYEKYYHDNNRRHCILGINPGRFGGGITGIPFTDPVRLEKVCGIASPWPGKQELSSVFIYDMIDCFGGAADFYSKFYITSVSPLGFVKNGRNLNYYDERDLLQTVTPFAVRCLEAQLAWGFNRSTAFCFGDGKNAKFLSKLNAQHRFFEKLIPLPHPRFIMQYKLRQKADDIKRYIDAFRSESFD